MTRILLAILLSVFSVGTLPAAIVGFASGDGSATSSTGNVYVITPHPVWDLLPTTGWPNDGRPQGVWVSAYPNTGYGGTVLPNTTVGGTPTMVFYQSFVLPGSVNSGQGVFGGDDTATILLNGQVVKAANPNQDAHCAGPLPIGCERGEFWLGDLSPFLVQGVNTLEIRHFQIHADASGVIYAGQFTSNDVPEPATFALAGFALVGFASFRKLRPDRRP